MLEDHRVAQLMESYWIQSVVQPPLLKNSPAADFLVSYYPDGVGMSATASIVPISNHIGKNDVSSIFNCFGF